MSLIESQIVPLGPQLGEEEGQGLSRLTTKVAPAQRPQTPSGDETQSVRILGGIYYGVLDYNLNEAV